MLVAIDNGRFRNEDYCGDVWGVPKNHAPVNLEGINQTCVHDVVVENINVYYDEKIEDLSSKYNILKEVNQSNVNSKRKSLFSK